jgi:hypothetical protein
MFDERKKEGKRKKGIKVEELYKMREIDTVCQFLPLIGKNH